jgi:DNA-binding MarR family transcriptional regulator
MGQIHMFEDDINLSNLGLDGKELSTFVNLLSRLISSSGETKEGPRKLPEQNLTAIAERVYRVRRRRDALMTARFGGEIFSDPAWDIILDLYIHNSKNQDVSVTSVCSASMVPITTALRYITVLSERGLIERSKNPKDGRSYLLRLTPEAIRIVEDLLADSEDGLDARPSHAVA